MTRTQLNGWAFGLVLGLAAGGSVASPPAQAQLAPVEPGLKQGAPDKKEPLPKVVVTSPQAKDVVVTQHYPCQIRARRHIKVRALVTGYLEEIPVREGQAVKKGDVLFKVAPTVYKAKLDAELAEVKIAEIELANVKKLLDQRVVSQGEVALFQAKLARAKARARLAEAELNFTQVIAPFDGLVGRQMEQQGSLVKEGDVLTTLTDNSVMWVYFSLPEARYFKYARARKRKDLSRLELVDSRIELVLADDLAYEQDAGNVVTVEPSFNDETGTIACRADFPNPDRLLRHGQTGTLLIHRTLKNVTVIPQWATFEILDRQYVYVVGKDNVVHARRIVVQNEVEDSFVVQNGLDVTDKIVLEGTRQIHDGDKVEYVFRKLGEGRPRTRRKK